MRSLYTPLWKKKLHYSERVYETAREIITRPEVVDVLGQRALNLLGVLEFMEPQAVRSGEVVSLDTSTDVTIPLISLDINEQVMMRATSANEVQRMMVTRNLGKEWVDKYLMLPHAPFPISIIRGSAAVCFARPDIVPPQTRSSGAIPLHVRGRPLVALAYYPQREFKHAVLSCLHETDHATMFLMNPIIIAETVEEIILREELSAYYTQSQIAGAMGIDDPKYAPHMIERIRRMYNTDPTSPGAFEPKQEIFDALRNQGLNILSEIH